MVDAAQQVVVDQVVLARLDAQAALATAVRDASILAFGGILLLFAWIVAMAALHGLLLHRLLPEASLGIIAGGNAIVGAILIGLGVGRLSRSGQEGDVNGRT
ncbi:MAG TPA: phage holin family protein [Candidatus Binatia bacterium]|nr:phage holin family protein [Candidatus Binatia bacterium]